MKSHKAYIDARVAEELWRLSVFAPQTQLVRRITTEFIRQAREILAEQGALHIDGLGSFEVKHVGEHKAVLKGLGGGKLGGRGIRVYFRKSCALRDLLKEKDHEQAGRRRHGQVRSR